MLMLILLSQIQFIIKGPPMSQLFQYNRRFITMQIIFHLLHTTNTVSSDHIRATSRDKIGNSTDSYDIHIN